MRKARTLITIDAPAKHENGVSVFVPTYIMQVTCPGTKDVLWVGVEKDQAKQGQWSQTELPSDGKKKKKKPWDCLLPILPRWSLSYAPPTYSAQKPKNTKFNSNFFGLALNNRLMAYNAYSTHGRPTTTQSQAEHENLHQNVMRRSGSGNIASA